MFETITHIFLIRGHSFLSCDQDFSLIERHKKKVTVETSEEWDNILQNARHKPSTFNIVNVEQCMVYDVKDTVSNLFLKAGRLLLILNLHVC